MRFAQPDNCNYAGALAGTGSVAKTSPGVLTLSGANSYQGGTLIQGGTVAVDTDNRLVTSGGSLTLDGGALELTSFDLSPSRAITVTKQRDDPDRRRRHEYGESGHRRCGRPY